MMDPLSIFTVILLTVFTVVFGFFKYSFSYWKWKGVPHEEPSIPYGSLKGLGKTFHINDITKKLYDKFKPTGAKLCGAYFFNRKVAILLDIQLIKTILIKDFEKFNERGLYHNEVDDPLTGNLFFLDGERWKKLRTKLTPTFSSGKLKYMFPTMVDVGHRFRDCIFEMVQQNDEIEMKDLCARFTTDIIGTCAFGIECNSLKDPNAEFRHYGRKFFTNPRHSTLMKEFLHGFKNFGQKLHIKYFLDDIAAFFMKVIDDTVKYRENNNINRNDFMDILIKLKNEATQEESITLNELAAQVFIFFLAGFETSSSALTFCLYGLALNPEIQTKARRIIQEAYRKHNGQFTYEMMMDIPYIDQILEETMRMYPPGPNLFRKAQSDYRIPDTNIIIERGTIVLCPVYAIQNDPEYYPNPGKFDPDRFNNDEKKKRDLITWLPFGAGPRNCIGSRFGMMQIQIGLVMLLNNFEFSITSNTSVPIVVTKTSSLPIPNDLHVKVKPLNSFNE